MTDGFIFYRSFWETLKRFPEKDLAEAVRALSEYALCEIEPEGLGILADTFFTMARPQIDANIKRKRDGAKGGKPLKTSGYGEVKPVVINSETGGYSEIKPVVTKPKTSGYEDVEPKEKVKEKVKEKDKDKYKNTYSAGFCAVWDAYPRKKEKSSAYKCYQARLRDGFSEDELLSAVKRYADQCRREHTEERYIKLASTFLGSNTPFLDYVREVNEDGCATKHDCQNTGYTPDQELLATIGDSEFTGF